MLALATARQPAPMLARGAVGLRRLVRPKAFGNALGSSIADSMQSAPDQSDAEWQRLKRYEGAALEQEAANNRTSLNAFNRDNDPYYSTSYDNWPDQTDAENARLNRYEAAAVDQERANNRTLLNRANQKADRSYYQPMPQKAAGVPSRAALPASDSDVIRTLLALSKAGDGASNARSSLKASGGLVALSIGNSNASSDVRGGPSTFGNFRGYGELNPFQKDLAAFGSDLPKVPYNLAVNTVEAGMNFIGSGALPGYPDYVPALNPLKIPYNNELSPYVEFGLGLAVAGVAKTNESISPLSGLKATEIEALLATGMSRAEAEAYVKTVGDVYLFRGTSEGFSGSPATQNSGFTPASIDPLVATAFALESKQHSGGGVVLFGSKTELATELNLGENRRVLEREIAVPGSPEEFANSAPNSISADRSRQILTEIDPSLELPARLYDVQHAKDTLANMPRMTAEQIRLYIEKAIKG